MLSTTYGYIFLVPLIVQQSTHLSIIKVGFITAALGLLGVPAMLLGAVYSDRAERHSALRSNRRTTATGTSSPAASSGHYMGLAKDLTGDYQRGLITLSIPCSSLLESCSTSADKAFKSATLSS